MCGPNVGNKVTKEQLVKYTNFAKMSGLDHPETHEMKNVESAGQNDGLSTSGNGAGLRGRMNYRAVLLKVE